MMVDHIVPRSKRPDLALDISNLQTLCGRCNRGKGSWDQTDWRPPVIIEQVLDLELLSSLRDRGLLH
jgi:5-methylcytosine-specific restriction endonuclease McrA